MLLLTSLQCWRPISCWHPFLADVSPVAGFPVDAGVPSEIAGVYLLKSWIYQTTRLLLYYRTKDNFSFTLHHTIRYLLKLLSRYFSVYRFFSLDVRGLSRRLVVAALLTRDKTTFLPVDLFLKPFLKEG